MLWPPGRSRADLCGAALALSVLAACEERAIDPIEATAVVTRATGSAGVAPASNAVMVQIIEVVDGDTIWMRLEERESWSG